MNPALGTNINMVLSNTNGHCVELLHRADDPCVWIIRSSKKFLWFRMNSSKTWFLDKQLALAFAQKQQEQQQN